MKSKSALEEAKEIIYGDRENTYGHPAKNLYVISKMWQAYLYSKDIACHLTPQDVAAMMVLLKVARFGNDPTHRDSVVDGIGYFALIDRINAPDEGTPNE